jgi:serine/threonine-protein kinase OSR1/STK39
MASISETNSPSSKKGEGEWPTGAEHYILNKDKDLIGKGAFANVYRAYCNSRNCYVAIKIMDLEKVTNGLTDIRNEVSTMKTCVHKNVLTCHACFAVTDEKGKDKLWMIMPYMDRGSALHLIRLLKEGGVREGLPETWVRYILSEALQGVKYLHDQNLLHRDLKAGNILLDSEGNVRIADFGVSGWLQEGGDRKNNRMTFVGTPCWMAPEVMEQADGYSYPADVWSMGITGLELAKGFAPYARYAPMKVLLKTLQEAPPTLQSYADEAKDKKTGKVPPAASGTDWVRKNKQFQEFVNKCLQREPDKRLTISKLLTMKYFKNAQSGKADIVKQIPELLPGAFQEKQLKKIPSQLKTAGEKAITGHIQHGRKFVPGVDFDFSDDEVEEEEEEVETGKKESAKDGEDEVAKTVDLDNVTDKNFGDVFNAETN